MFMDNNNNNDILAWLGFVLHLLSTVVMYRRWVVRRDRGPKWQVKLKRICLRDCHSAPQHTIICNCTALDYLYFCIFKKPKDGEFRAVIIL